MTDNKPFYNLKAVVKEVGLSPVTLRAWERRYGLPRPQRTSGGHRLYSRQDIEMLKWLMDRQRDGLNISSAIELWKSQPESHPDLSKVNHAPDLEPGTGEIIIDELRDNWLSACLQFDDQAASQILDQAFAIAAPEVICTQVLLKGLAQLGDRWYNGSASVQQEHFASAIAIRRVSTLLAVTASIPPSRAGHILVACPPGEEHDFILLLIGYLLRRYGWEVVYLGANVPLRDLDATIQSTSPVLIVSAAQTLPGAASLRQMSEFIASLGILLAYGGGIFTCIPRASQSISGFYLGTDVMSVPQIVEPMLTSHIPITPAQPISVEYSHALAKFMEKEALIVSSITYTGHAETIDESHFDIANLNINRHVESALILGDMDYLDYAFAWLNGLLNNNGISALEVRQYLSAYLHAIEQHVGQDGAMIQEWLSKQIASV